jgi:hypothetical protein
MGAYLVARFWMPDWIKDDEANAHVVTYPRDYMFEDRNDMRQSTMRSSADR